MSLKGNGQLGLLLSHIQSTYILTIIYRLIFYDAHGRSGIAAKAFDHGMEGIFYNYMTHLSYTCAVFDILRDAETAVAECGCEDGCYKCTYIDWPVVTVLILPNLQACKVVSASKAIKSRQR